MSLSNADIERLREILKMHRSRKFNAGRPDATRDNEAICDDCSARITVTTTLGEVGHQIDCPRRETAYTGQRGRRQTKGRKKSLKA